MPIILGYAISVISEKDAKGITAASYCGDEKCSSKVMIAEESRV